MFALPCTKKCNNALEHSLLVKTILVSHASPFLSHSPCWFFFFSLVFLHLDSASSWFVSQYSFWLLLQLLHRLFLVVSLWNQNLGIISQSTVESSSQHLLYALLLASRTYLLEMFHYHTWSTSSGQSYWRNRTLDRQGHRNDFSHLHKIFPYSSCW